MTNMIRNALVVCIGVGLVGCEWQGGGDGSSWNSRYNFVNFSGNYRGAGGGGMLVSAYTGTAVQGGGTSGDGYTTINDESDGSRTINLGAVQTLFTGATNGKKIKPGSLTIRFGGDGSGTFRDDGSGGLSGSAVLSGIVNVSGTGSIQYDTGEWSILLNAPGIPGEATVTITLSYLYQGSIVVPDTGDGGGSGATKVTIYAFNVFQEGNKLRIVDNNGSVYEGGFGSIRSTGGIDQDTTQPQFANGDQIMGQFEAKGRSAANIAVHMVGTFQATIAASSTAATGGGTATTTMQLTDRRILGTWIESNGKTGDINGQAVPITVSTTTSTNSPSM